MLHEKPKTPSLAFGGAATSSSSNKPAPAPSFYVQPVVKPSAAAPSERIKISPLEPKN
jgi:hypothetical protein